MLNLNEIMAACEAATPGPWQCGPLGASGYVLAFQDNSLSWNNDLLYSENREADAQLCAKARTWLPALVAELRRIQAECDTLAALVPLYRAVDDYLHKPGTNDYPDGHCNPDRLAVLRETFLGMEMADDQAELEQARATIDYLQIRIAALGTQVKTDD